jgi:hypothetical protein
VEVYILDSLLRRTTVVDVYQSLIWTERWTTWGDFQLDIVSTPATRRLFTAGTKLAINNSYRVMTVESVGDGTDADGRTTLTLKGRSLEGTVLDSRAAMLSLTDLTWDITDTPKNIMTTVFDHIVRNGTISPGDKLPLLQPGSIFPADTNQVAVDSISVSIQPDSVYNVLNNIGETYGLGFRIVRNFDMSQLFFDVYAGSDRTSGQSLVDPVIFSPELENLQNTSELFTIDKHKNVAYVYSGQGSLIVYAGDVDASVAGFDRNVMLVQASDLDGTPTQAQIATNLLQAGKEALAQNTTYAAFDGEVNQFSKYKYGTHYNLGDMVEQRNSDGIANKMRVTEQIFASDSTGERSYPTLTTYQYVNVGSWLAWNNNQTWADLESDSQTWSDQP